MLRKLSLFFKRAAMSSDEIKEAKRFVGCYTNNERAIRNVNCMLNAQKVAENLELLGTYQNNEKDILYYDHKTNQILVKSLFDD